jgi:hypothetical protein
MLELVERPQKGRNEDAKGDQIQRSTRTGISVNPAANLKTGKAEVYGDRPGLGILSPEGPAWLPEQRRSSGEVHMRLPS